MRIAVFSDVHGNLTALQAVLNHIDKLQDLDHIVFAGDLCLFGPRPQACLDLVLSRNLTSIVGNTDEWILHPPPISEELTPEQQKYRELLRARCEWTYQSLEVSAREWLDELRNSFELRYVPDPAKDDDLLIVHANPVDLYQLVFPSEEKQLMLYGLIRQPDTELEPLFQDVKASVVAFGHLHVPGERQWGTAKLVNISSVSMPGDRDGRAKYVVFTWRSETGWESERFYIDYPAEDEIQSFYDEQPPGWEKQIEQLKTLGYYPQTV